jgi:quinol monooxygenase YgiN
MKNTGRVVIACYRPKPGQHEALRALLLTHVPTLRSLGLETSRVSITMQAKDGTFVEVFEWASPQAIEAAHGHPDVRRMWQEYGKLCDYVPVAQVPEASQMFSEFTPVEAET